MKDRVLLVLAGLACAVVAQLTWSKFPNATFVFVLLGLFVSFRENQRIERVKRADRKRVALARAPIGTTDADTGGNPRPQAPAAGVTIRDWRDAAGRRAVGR
ncbi:hypothetical protein [Rugamonas sp.]|uniref:hypothetical protein n=1 Tax=Rugamonas sp. TaxID=1926287 RepID=UPI0025E0BB81|nr:hypothetical protein [Rugamonas sp.]